MPVKIPIEGVLDLHTFLPKDIPGLVEDYLTECLEARIYCVRIIHGKGKGVQRNRVHGLLKRLSIVASFSEATVPGGGWGATIVELKKEKELPSPKGTQFCECLTEGGRALGIDLDPAQIEQFALHKRELVEWNRFANLTAVTDAKELAEKLFLDTLPLVSSVPSGARVLDIGSGGGFPGLPLKVMRPDLDVLLVDASRKKANFLRHVIRTLDLKGIQARHIRAEALAKEVQTMGHPFDVIVSKAAFKLERLLDHALPLLHTPGMIIAMKGIAVEAELQSAQEKIRATGLEVEVKGYRLPGSGIERSLVILGKT
ncbi:MAG: 16S rRNA (guanine(527)-N(7))-methyltransferase RsmG [Thermodesulfobacteriota bacterium]|nr:16S rRNA (guanine(527)-N(7))-methyltransferase RsmG [Thermodesulfobacteriota bacterium]